MDPIELDYAEKMKPKDLVRAEELAGENIDLIREKWHEVHGN